MKMKNKKAEQIVQKQAHKARLQEAKRRRPAPDFELPLPVRQERQHILIVCEGFNTEPDYFNQFRQYFRMTAVEIQTIGGVGETIRVVERAIREQEKGSFDQIWVVFDKDDFPPDNFDNAIHMAEAAGLHPAYSNQAFEYWLILHFEDHQGGALHREQYADKINAYLKPFGISYDAQGNKRISPEFFRILVGKDEKSGESRLDLAIKRAERVLGFHKDNTPATSESCTTVFQLVRALLEFV
jgi:hypothetical protein